MSTKCLLWTGSASLLLWALGTTLVVCLQLTLALGTMALGFGVNALVALHSAASLPLRGASAAGMMCGPAGHTALLAELALIPTSLDSNAPVAVQVPSVLGPGLLLAAVPLAAAVLCFGAVLRRWLRSTRGA